MQEVPETRSNPPHGGPMSIWSCARHNGMTGAGSDRDVGPTPVQRARFREECSRERRRVRIYWRRLECTRCTPGRQQRERSRRTETNVSVTSRSAASINCFPYATAKWRGVRYPAPSGFARGLTVPVRPVRGPAHASRCSKPAVDASRYNARRVD